MNKKEATELAARIAADAIERRLRNKGEPLTYDYIFNGAGVEGLRLSEADHDRVTEALDDIQDKLILKGNTTLDMPDGSRRHFLTIRWPKPSGKPGARWTKYKGYLRD